jgi:hypothetical protein
MNLNYKQVFHRWISLESVTIGPRHIYERQGNITECVQTAGIAVNVVSHRSCSVMAVTYFVVHISFM